MPRTPGFRLGDAWSRERADLTDLGATVSKIGLYGGSFDPVHIGHLMVANAVQEALSLDYVQFIPTPQNPLKPYSSHASAEHRINMLEIATANNPKFIVNDWEVRRGKAGLKVYSVDIISRYATVNDPDIFYIIGGDILPELHKWHRIHDALELCTFVAVPRVGTNPKVKPFKFSKSEQEKITILSPEDIMMTNISSSRVRGLRKTGNSIQYIVPAGVDIYIEKYYLYK